MPRLLRREFHGDVTLQAAHKDIVNIQDVTRELGAKLPLVETMIAIYERAIAEGFGDEAKSAMVKLYEGLDRMSGSRASPGRRANLVESYLRCARSAGDRWSRPAERIGSPVSLASAARRSRLVLVRGSRNESVRRGCPEHPGKTPGTCGPDPPPARSSLPGKAARLTSRGLAGPLRAYTPEKPWPTGQFDLRLARNHTNRPARNPMLRCRLRASYSQRITTEGTVATRDGGTALAVY